MVDLPEPLGPKQAEHFAAANFEVDLVDRARFGTAPKIFEHFGQAAHGDDHLVGRGGGRGFGRARLGGRLSDEVLFGLNDGHIAVLCQFRGELGRRAPEVAAARFRSELPERSGTAPILRHDARGGRC